MKDRHENLMLGVSTCWWQGKMLSGEELVDDIVAMGFRGVELEYRISRVLYEQMMPSLKERLNVLSIHNFFPFTEKHGKARGSGDLFLLSAIDEEERLRAVEFTLKTLAHASDLEARVVILHLGRVDMADPTGEFRRLYGEGLVRERDGLEFMLQQRHIRKARSRKHLEAVLHSLDALNRDAEQKGVLLGIENRYYFQEIPNFDEIGEILQQFEGGSVRYWHDVGHAGVQEQLGICRQRELLETYGERMVGVHLHDLIGIEDHFAPGQGKMHYEEIVPFFRPDVMKILEVHPKVARNELTEGVRHMNKMLQTYRRNVTFGGDSSWIP